MPNLESVPTDEMKQQLPSFTGHGNKVQRFCVALAAALKPEVTPDGFIWAAEGVLLGNQEEYEEFDRLKIRNLLPRILSDVVLDSRMNWFVETTKEILADIKRGTMNLG